MLQKLTQTYRREVKINLHFTTHRDEKINKKIERDLSVISQTIIQNFSNIEALILVGGFGRGEGSVIFDNGSPKPLNDYDVAIIVKEEPELTRLKKLSEEIAKDIGIRAVDLIPIKGKKLTKLPYTMFNHDMKYGGYVFYGRKEILNEIPDYNPLKMPLVEGKKLLFNRMICLLECYTEEFRNREPDDKEKFLLANQCSKAILACCDSFLLLKGLYHHSYAERCRRFTEKFKRKEKLIKLIQRATDFKLRPTRKIDFDVTRYWFDTRKEFIETLKHFLETFYKRKLKDWKEFSAFYKKEGNPLLRRLINTVRKRKTIEKNIELFEIFLLNAINGDLINSGYLNSARLTLNKVSNKKFLEDADWETLRKECVRLWFKYLH